MVGLTILRNKTEFAGLWSVPSFAETTAYTKPAGQRRKHTAKLAYFEDVISVDTNVSIEISRRVRAA